MSGTEITLTGPYDGIETSLEACANDLKEASTSLYEACSDHTETILSEIFEESTIVPGSELADSVDRSAFNQFIEKQHTEYWFADLNGRGSDLDLGWDSFKSVVRLYTEYIYLKAFRAYKTANEELSEIGGKRNKADTLFEDIEIRLQRDRTEPAAEDEEPLETLVSEANELVTDVSELLESAKTAVVRSHAYYAIAECYRDEYEFDSDDFSYVSLSDDADWYFEDLRHRRDRSETRVRWVRKDFSKLNTNPQQL